MDTTLTLTDVAKLAETVKAANAQLADAETAQLEAEARLTRWEQFAERAAALGPRLSAVYTELQAKITALNADRSAISTLIEQRQRELEALDVKVGTTQAALAEITRQLAATEQALTMRRDELTAIEEQFRKITQVLN
jgi:chromosome segregation ATPase